MVGFYHHKTGRPTPPRIVSVLNLTTGRLRYEREDEFEKLPEFTEVSGSPPTTVNLHPVLEDRLVFYTPEDFVRQLRGFPPLQRFVENPDGSSSDIMPKPNRPGAGRSFADIAKLIRIMDVQIKLV
jgi:hypothetical protein